MPSANPAMPSTAMPTANEGASTSEEANANEGASLPTVTQASEGDSGTNDLFAPEMIILESAGHRRSPRIAAQEPKKYNFLSAVSKLLVTGVVLLAACASPVTVFSHGQASVNRVVHKCNVIHSNFDGTANEIHHMVLAAGKSNNETYTFREMLKQDDAAEFIKAMKKEAEDHERGNHWQVVPRSSIPPHTKIIQAIWSFKRKRFPDGSLNKYKARLCAHGGMQQWGVNYWETYAPVVNWISVRFLLILSELSGLESRAIDFVLAFPQAPLDVPVYMELPLGMEIEGD